MRVRVCLRVCDCNADVGPAQVLFLNGSTWIQLMSGGRKVTPLHLKMKAQCMQREKAAIHVWLSQAFTGVKDKCIVCHCFSQYYSFKLSKLNGTVPCTQKSRLEMCHTHALFG